MQVRSSLARNRWMPLIAALICAVSSVSAQFVWDGTTSLAATTLGGNTVGPGVTLAITTAADHNFPATAIVNNGTVTWVDGRLRSGDGGSFTNNAAFNDTLASNTVVNADYGDHVASFTNSLGAVYHKSGNAVTHFAGVPFYNDGTVNILASTFQLSAGGGNSSSGVFNTAAGALTLFTNNYTLANGSNLNGLGTYQLSSGALSVSGSVKISNFSQTGGTLVGTQTFSNSALNWTGGVWNSSGITTLAAGTTLTIAGGADHDYNARAIINQGVVNWSGGRLRSGDGGSFTNNAAFNDTLASNTEVNADYGDHVASFVNSTTGTYAKTGAAVTHFAGAPFTNAGFVSVQAGTLQLAAGGANAATGVFSTSAGALTLFSNSYTLAAGSSLRGSGTYQLSAGSFVANGPIRISNFSQTGGTLVGTQTFFRTAFNWSGGNWNSGGATTLDATSTLTLSGGDHDYNARAIVNQGLVNWNSGRLRSGDSGSFTNKATFNDNVTTSTDVNADYGDHVASFTNFPGATYTKTGNALTHFAGVPFYNDGTVNVRAGTLQLSAGGANSGTGTILTSAGALTLFSNNYAIANGSALTGLGTYQLAGGSFSVTGTVGVSTFNQTGGTLVGTQTFANTAFNWTGGTWNTSGITTLGTGTTLTLSGGVDHDYNGRAIVNQGTVNWTSGRLRSGDGGSFTNKATLNDNVSTASDVNADYGDHVALFTNFLGGTYNKTGNAVTNFTGVPFYNDGTVNVQAGTFQLSAGGANSATGVFNTAAGALTLFTNNYTIASGSALNGLGTYQLSGGAFSVSGTASVTNFNQTGGTLVGTQTFTNTGLNWSGGTWNSSGATTLGTGTTLTLSGGVDHDFNGRAIINQGTVNWTAGRLRSGDGGSFTNQTTFNDNVTTSTEVNADYGDHVASFTNALGATYKKTGNALTNFSGVPFYNDGTVNVQAGTFQLSAGGTNSGTGVFHAAAGTSVVIANNYSLAAGSKLTGAGTYVFSGGTLITAGTLSISALLQTGGALAGTATFNNSVINWNAGVWNTSGTFTLGSTSILNITSAADHDYNARAIVNQGTINWSGGRLRSGDGGSITNAGTFNDTLATATEINADYGNHVTSFINNGTYNKTAAGTTTLAVPVTNTGTINATAGTLAFTSSFTNTGGTLNPTGGNLVFSSPLNVGTGTLRGTGSITAPTVTAGGIVAPGNSAGLLTITGNLTLLSSATSQFEIAGTTRGTRYDALDVSGAATLAGTLSLAFINGGYAALQNTDTLTLLNAASVTGAFANIAHGSRLSSTDGNGSFQVNVTGSTITLTQFLLGANTFVWNGGNLNTTGNVAPTLLSASTVPAGSRLAIYTNADHDFNATTVTNNGIIDWNDGRLRSGSSGSIFNAGTWNDSATSEFNNDFGGTAWQFTNTGTYLKTTGTTNAHIPFNNSGTVTTASGGTLLLNAGGTIGAGALYNGNGQTILNSGTFTASGLFTSLNLVLGGSANLSGNSSLDGTLTWTSGTFNNGSTTTIPASGTLLLSTSSDHDFNTHAFVNHGTINWTGGRLRSGSNGAIVNNALFLDAASVEFNNDYGGGAWTFTNAATGTYRKTATGTTNVQVPFHNAGTVTIADGILALNAGGTISSGALYNGNGQTLLNVGTYTAAGTFTTNNLILGGTANLTGNASFTGTLTWTSGNFNNGSTTTIPLGATLQAATTADHNFNTHAFINHGTFEWNAGRLRSGSSGSILNNALFLDATNSELNNDYGGSPWIFTNSATGTYRKTAAGTTNVNVPFNNAGTVTIADGLLSLNGGGTISAGALFNGAGQTLLNTGTYTTTGLFTSSNLVLGGSANLTGTSSLGGTLAWTTGNFNNGSTSTIPSGSTLKISTGANHDFNTHTFFNQGTIEWAAGSLRSGSSGAIVNQALFIDAASSQLNNDYGGAAWTFTNSATGTYRKIAAGTTNVGIPFHNAGTVTVNEGTLTFDGGGSISPGAVFNGPGQALLNTGSYATSGLFTATNLTLGGGATLTGNSSLGGTFTWTSGHFNNGSTTTIPVGATLSIATGANHDFNTHAFVINGTVNWTGGALRSGSSGSILNAGTWNDTASAAINNDYGGAFATFTNSGTYNKLAAGTTTVSIPFINQGSLVVTEGTLRFASTFQQTAGTLNLSSGTNLQFDTGLSLTVGTLSGTGTVVGNISSASVIAPGHSPGTLNVTGNLSLLSTSTLLFELGGISQGDDYDFLSVSGNAALGGSLQITVISGFGATLNSTQTFSILSSSVLSGAFTNVASGQRLYSSDGVGSFLVNYGAGSAFGTNNVVLTNFVPVPEPATYALLVLGLIVVAVAAHRRPNS